jgi:hypothetical protein
VLFGSSRFSTYFCSVFLPWKICGAFILSYRDESTMKVIRHESLGIYIYAKPKNQMEKKYNLNLMARAEAIRCRRFEAIVNKRYDFFDKEKMKGDFLAYFKRLADKKTPSGNTSICTSVPIIASIEYIAASQYIFAVSHKEALCIKTNGCTFAA